MTYAEAVHRLVNHASLPASAYLGSELPIHESLLDLPWLDTGDYSASKFEFLADDVIACLGVVNRELNGTVPSESFDRSNESVIVEVAYPVACIISGLLGHDLSRRPVLPADIRVGAAYRIAYAWSQVLAGDIDNLLEGADLP